MRKIYVILSLLIIGHVYPNPELELDEVTYHSIGIELLRSLETEMSGKKMDKKTFQEFLSEEIVFSDRLMKVSKRWYEESKENPYGHDQELMERYMKTQKEVYQEQSVINGVSKELLREMSRDVMAEIRSASIVVED